LGFIREDIYTFAARTPPKSIWTKSMEATDMALLPLATLRRDLEAHAA
jgi:hypothetical protein